MSTVFTGGCLCGAVRYQSSEEPVLGGHCYCTDCRKTSGTGHGSHIVLPEAAFSISGDVTFYDAPTDTGNTVSRGFCPTCGSAVYSTNSGMPGMVFPRASSLDDLEVFKPQMNVYAHRAASWDKLDPSVPSNDGRPPSEDMPSTQE